MGDAFVMACDDGDADAVRNLLAEGADPDTVDDGFPVLYQAAAVGRAALVELLLSANASVDTPNEEGATPLCIAAQNGHTAVIELLLATKASVDTPTQDGATPLSVAAQQGHTAAVERLLGAGADPHHMSNQHENVIWSAAYSGSAKIVRMLLLRGADPSLQSHSDDKEYANMTALDVALKQGHAAVAALLRAETMHAKDPPKKKKRKSGKGTDRATVKEGQMFIQRAEARKAATSKPRSKSRKSTARGPSSPGYRGRAWCLAHRLPDNQAGLSRPPQATQHAAPEAAEASVSASDTELSARTALKDTVDALGGPRLAERVRSPQVEALPAASRLHGTRATR
jgi:ankyrin repeat protein